MSGAGYNARNRKMTGGGNMLMRIVGFILIIAVIAMMYYLYQWLYVAGSTETVVSILKGNLASDTNNASLDKPPKDTAVPISYTKRVGINGLEAAGQYSLSMWVYAKDTKAFLSDRGGKLVNLLEISHDRFNTNMNKRGDTLLFIGLNPINGGLVVRQNTNSSDASIKNNNKNTGVDHIILNYNGAKSTYKTNDRCDIVNGIEYQRWVLVTVVVNSRTLDVYLDGKLARSCVYATPYSVNGMGSADVYLGANNGVGFKGHYATTDFYNYALTPDAVWKIYQTGPAGPFSLKSWLYNFMSVSRPVSPSNI